MLAEATTATREIRSILLIDDDRTLCSLMAEFFSMHDFRLDSAHDGPSGLSKAFEGGHDLIILDWMLPSLNGIEILKQLRQRSSTPVVMLSAKTTHPDRIAGLESGADDYLPKPFDPKELLARVRAVLRRMEQQTATSSRTVQVGNVMLDREAREVWCGNQRLDITSFEFDILDVLLRSAGRVVSRDELATALYQRTSTPFERGIDVHICHLRKKLGPEGSKLIRSIRSVGYMFVVN